MPNAHAPHHKPNDTHGEASVAYLARVLGVRHFLLPLQMPDFSATAAHLANHAVDQSGHEAPLIEADLADTVATAPLATGPFATAPVATAPVGISIHGPLQASLVFIAPQKSLEGPGGELLSRMVLAMKQDPAQVLRLGVDERFTEVDEFWGLLACYPRAAVVVLGADVARMLSAQAGSWTAARWLEPRTGINLMLTHSLHEMRAKPECKRVVWQHLQMVMLRLRV